MPRGIRDRARVGLERLHEHATRCIPPAAAGELRQELEGALLGAKVGQPEAHVGVNDRRQLDAGKVMAFRHHLRADEHRALRSGKALERGAQLLGLLDRVCVEADHLELGHLLREHALETLRAGADARKLGRPARGARLPEHLEAPAVMAAQ